MVEQDAVVQTGEKSLTSHRIAHTFLLPETLLLVKLLSAFCLYSKGIRAIFINHKNS